MLGGIFKRDVTYSGSDFWYSHTWNPTIVIIMDRNQVWNYLSSNWDIIVSGNWINSYLPYHACNLNLGSNSIFIELVSAEWCDICLCTLSSHDLSIKSSVNVSAFNTPAIISFSLRIGQSWIIFIAPGFFLILVHYSLENNLVILYMSAPLHDLVLLNLSLLTCDTLFCYRHDFFVGLVAVLERWIWFVWKGILSQWSSFHYYWTCRKWLKITTSD